MLGGSDPSPSAAFYLELEDRPVHRMLAMRIDTPVADTLCGAITGGALMLVGPVGGLVSVRYSLKVEPLTALGLAQ